MMTMRRITILIVSTLAALVLLFSYRTSTGGSLPGAVSAAAAPGVVPDATSATPSGSPPPGTMRTMTVNGTVAQTRWGPVQVQIKILGKTITDVRVLRRPTGSGQDDQINGYALPQLRQQVLQAQSARIDGVSVATVTSGGYRESLQAALDAAHLG
jgi:uncharacterized protein with FMN-binding domain